MRRYALGLALLVLFVPAGAGQTNSAEDSPANASSLPPLPEPTRPEKDVLLYRVNLGKEKPCRQVRVYLPEKPGRDKVPCVLVAPTATTARDLDGTDPEEYLPYVRVGFAVVAYAFDEWGVTRPEGKHHLKVEGKVTDDDPRDGPFPKSPRQSHTVKLAGGKRVQIDLTSKDVDAYLRVENETGKVLAEDDDGGGNFNSRLVFAPAKNGTYRLVVTCFPNNRNRPKLTGAYVLTVADVWNAELAGMRGCMKDEHGLVTARQALDYALAKVPAIDAGRIYGAGHSNGGFLSLLAASRDQRFKGCISYNGPVDMDRLYRSWFRLPYLYEYDILDEPGFWDFVHNVSPMTHVSSLRCPVYLFHAKDDWIVAGGLSRYIEELKKTNKNVTVDIVEKGGHVEPMVREGRPRAIRWLQKLEANHE